MWSELASLSLDDFAFANAVLLAGSAKVSLDDHAFASAVSVTGSAKVTFLGRRCKGLSMTAGAPTEYPLGS